MDIATKQKVMAAVEQYLARHGMTAAELARKSGVNNSYLSLMRQGSFESDAGGGKKVEIADRYFEMLARFVGHTLQKTYWEPVPTVQMKQILAALEDARQFGSTCVITGETGSGKTFVSRMFQRNYPLDCYLVTAGSADNIGDLLEKVCEQLGVATEKTKSKTLRAVARRMQSLRFDGLRPLLIFDEAEYMKQPALCNLKELYDALNGQAGLVLLGTDQLNRNIERMRRKNRDGIPQLYRRIKFGYRPLNNIDRTFRAFLDGKDYQADVKKFLREHCDNYGELHDVLVPALREADRSGRELNVQLIRTMLNMPNS
jgi:DNA transposition AAA+ family ATPase